ncbi:DUF2525 domain-containing protein [Pantoea sp. Eser]|nr:DUF2525 domain-containing protein [Pantoea sp. Eser]
MSGEKQVTGLYQSAMNIDVDRLLESIIQAGNAGEMQEFMAQPSAADVRLAPQLLPRGTELADAFEMDICDCRSFEANC